MIRNLSVRQTTRALGLELFPAHYSVPSLVSRLPSTPFRASCLNSSRSFKTSSRRHYADQPQANSESQATAGGDGAAKEGAPAASEAAAASAGAAKGQTGPLDSLRKELAAKDSEIIELKDKYLRSIADFRNLQERTKRDVASARDFALQRFARDLVDSVDNLDRALETVPGDKLGRGDTDRDLQNLHDGLKMTERILMQTLGKHGLERFDPSAGGTGGGEKFDPNLHEASFMTKMEDREDGTVFSTMQKGFKLNGRVIRAAKVGVVKNT